MILPRLLIVLLATAALAGVATVAGAESSSTPRTVVVADASVPRETAAAAQRAAGPGTEVRFPRTATEQLSVTHLFAARGYVIVGIGLSRAIAVDPVARHYRGTEFTLIDMPVDRTVAAPER